MLIAFCCSGGLPASAAPPTAAVVELFRYGQVEGNSSAYRIGENGGIFLKIIKGEKSRCLKLDKPGDYPIAQVMVETDESATFFDFFKCNLKALVLRLKTPSRMVITPIPRGASPDDKNSDRIFEEIWRKTVLGETADIPAENMLAAAIWYSGEKRNPARSAYILEKAYDQYRRDWFLQLHHDAYASTAPSSIDREVDKTKNSLLNYYSTDSNIALLIGVQNYGKDSGWPALRTPINDIRKLRNLLVHEYHFNPDNVH
ncbi:MAG: hypothetical protein GY866_29445, partial [Proteobacteria bacterium]|nr:hypothetical protein [Pseudomonadota bacterium]